MPSEDAKVGGLVLPLPAGALNQEIADPTVLGIGDFLRFTLRRLLNARLARMQGTSADAVPEGHMYPYDPAEYFVRNGLPALYVWWTGRSSRQPWTLLYDARVRQIRAMYVFDELVAPGALRPRHGLIAAVDASFALAAEEGQHPDYGYGGSPPGTPLAESLGLLRWTYEGAEQGFLAPLPAAAGDLEGAVQRGFPCLQATFAVLERVFSSGEPVSPDDENNRLDLEEYTTELDPVADGLLIRRKTIPGP